MVFSKTADAEYAETQNMPLPVDPFHKGIIRRWSHEARRLTELYFQVVRFRIKPHFFFFGQTVSPGLNRSVK